MAHDFDAIIVGSGISGSWAALELTKAGLQTLVLEAGAAMSLERWSQDGLVPGSSSEVQRGSSEQQPIQEQCYACSGPFRELFVSDAQNPYISGGGAGFAWIRGRHLGGRSLTWARTCFRLGAADFRAEAGSAGIEWPISYAELEPSYRRVERWIGLAGHRDRLPQVPDSECLGSFGFNAAEEVMGQRLQQRYGAGRHLIQSRVATLTSAHRGRPAYRARRHQTHPVQDAAHFTALSSTLPAAARTGKLHLHTNSVVSRLIYDSQRRCVAGVEVIDALTLQHRVWRAPLVVLAASALESTRILLNSRCPEFPTGLGNTSDCLGRYLMDHLTGVGAIAEFPDIDNLPFVPGRPATSYVPRYRNLGVADTGFVGGYAFICDAFRPSADGAAVFRESAGARNAESGNWVIRLWGFGECVPQRSNHVRIASDDAGRDPARALRDRGDQRNGKDAWGVPILNVDFSWSDNERDMARDMAQTAAEMLEACGGKHVKLLDTPLAPGLAIHEMGTARMGLDPRSSVVNGFGQSHDLCNLYVVDGAVMPTSPCQNPSLTYMAFASRAARHAALQLRKGNLRPPQRTAMLTLSAGASVFPGGNGPQGFEEPTPREDETNA